MASGFVSGKPTSDQKATGNLPGTILDGDEGGVKEGSRWAYILALFHVRWVYI